MKIFYAIQATGNGHISRASELIPVLQNFGEVDVFLSGSNYSLKTNLPIAYRSKGLSFAYNKEKGAINLAQTIKNLSIRKIWNEAKFLPVEKYDLVINDFECITSLACRIKRIKSIQLGHQASFTSKKVPRPIKKDVIGEWILQNYAKGSENFGFHFKEYDVNIYNPIIRKTILQSNPEDKGHITIYLGQYHTQKIIEAIEAISDFSFEIFCKETKSVIINKNYKILPVSQELFTQSLINCHGIITGAGFETPAEALYLNKKLMVIPLKGQYEQLCNAAALREFKVQVYDDLINFKTSFLKWIQSKEQQELILTKSVHEIISEIIARNSNTKITELPSGQWDKQIGEFQKQVASF